MMERELTQLIETMRQAGARARELAVRGFQVHTKKDHSPVTTADLEVNRMLHEMQQTHFPKDGWLSEESPDDPSRLERPRVWIVDPIDGTKAYVNRLPDYCISVALVERGKPVLAGIYNPSTDEFFTALRGQGLLINGKPVASLLGPDSPLLVMVTSREYRNGQWAGLDGLVQCRPMFSIANALALVAAGRIHATITIEQENEWDLAAGVLLIEESGGAIADAAGNPFVFNQEKPRFDGVIAVAAKAGKDLRQLLQTHADQARANRNKSRGHP
ncbi:3'(2'),5'-bisphosphate nucleotidase CysQ [Petrachloros mirabilis]